MFHLSIPPFPLTPGLFTVSLVLLFPEYHVVRIPHSSVGKESACIAGDLGSIPGLGRSSGEGKRKLPTPVFWGGEFHGLYSPWGCKELDKTKLIDLGYF